MKSLKPAIFLDRDGVINQPIVLNKKPFSPRKIEDFKLMPGLKEALTDLKKNGYFLAIVTNQPDVGRGLISQEIVEEMHRLILSELPIDAIAVCYDDGKKVNSQRRKPNPGMILELSQIHDLDLKRSFVIGDRWSDIAAGKNAGCQTIFIDYEYDEKIKDEPDFRVKEIKEGINIILKNILR